VRRTVTEEDREEAVRGYKRLEALRGSERLREAMRGL
jgi:hypothetical protein